MGEHCGAAEIFSHEYGFTDEDLAAEVLVYSMICEAEDGKDDEKSDD